MIIKRLKLENWKTFDDVEFTFTQGLNIIEGSNYSGKTAFIQALYFALFNETLYKQLTTKDLKKEGEKDASVVFDFTVDGQEYRIRRNISGERVIKTGSYIYRLEKGSEVEELESVSRKGEKLTKIEDLLKINARFVKNINFIQEGSISQLLNDPKTKILEDIYNILQLDYFNEINDYCNMNIKSTGKEVKELETKNKEASEASYIVEDRIKNIDKEIEDLKLNEEGLKTKISESEKKLKKFSELKNLISVKEKLTSQVIVISDKKDYISKDLEILERDLKELEEIEKQLIKLGKQSDLYHSNEKKLKDLQNEWQNLNDRLNLVKQNELLLRDKKSQLENFQKDLNEQRKAQKELDNLIPKLKSLEIQHSKFHSFVRKLDEIKGKMEQKLKIIENFKRGICPITERNCPVSENFIGEYTKSLEQLKGKKQAIEDQLRQLKNPEQEYYDLLKQKNQFKDIDEKINRIKRSIENIEKEIDIITQGEEEKQKIESRLMEIDGKINLVKETNKTLLKYHENYISKKEKVKEKEKLLNKIEKKESEIKEIDIQISENENKIKIKEDEITQFKSSHKIVDISELDKENKKYNNWKNELADVKIKIQNNVYKKEQSEKEKVSLIEPFKSIEEIYAEIERLVHKQHKIIFFQDALNLTLDELKSRKLKSIQDFCNKMWHKFRLDSGTHLVEWDDNFLPILKIGGIERNLYQLSASEKMFIYFSIRAALLAELGPNYFIIVDNLFNPFMIDNQKVVIEQIKKIVDETNINQIIFTGFDISPDVESDNHIKI